MLRNENNTKNDTENMEFGNVVGVLLFEEIIIKMYSKIEKELIIKMNTENDNCYDDLKIIMVKEVEEKEIK